MGRPSTYSPQIASEICDRISQGQSIRTIGEAEGMPEARSIFNWLNKYPDFVHQYTLARATRAHVRFERVDSVLEDLRAGTIDSNMARVEIDTIKWQCGKEAPKKYGDRIEIAGDAENPLNVNVTQSTELLASRIDQLITRSRTPEIPEKPE